MRPIAECRLGERVVFVIDVENGQVVAVTNCERVSAVYDRARWFRSNGHLAEPVNDFVAAAAAHAMARRALSDRSPARPVPSELDLTFARLLDEFSRFSDGWDDFCIGSVAPDEAAITGARAFVEEHQLPDPELDLHIDGTVTLQWSGDNWDAHVSFDASGLSFAWLTHDESTLGSDDVPLAAAIGLAIGLIRTAGVDADSRSSTFLLVHLVRDDGSPEDYWAAIDTQEVTRTFAPSGLDDLSHEVGLAIASAHLDASELVPQRREPLGPAPPPFPTDVLQSSLGVEVVECRVFRFPSRQPIRTSALLPRREDD